ncbi:CIC11C00000002456 [Sungouiella intermedia]|uniref:CIC11C00000002456 n=1 Tax=Sungouiella intermedia TaxID=45354 RepID=A0A1L0BGU2_9ASCO|nr:CIC11C00000002456 [[Candida] intermedia]
MNTEVSERKARRYFIGSSGRLKGNKVTVSEPKSRPQKPKKDEDTHVTVESPEFQLLVRLYVPAKLLIKNNKVLRKQLSNYLPVIVNETVPELNFELHIFLSSIVTTYISSWYLTKLNTDNLDFLEDVYGILCDFVKDFARRVLAIVELPELLDMVEDWAHILDNHIRLVHIQNGVPCFVGDYLEKSRDCVCSEYDLSVESITDRFLQDSHVIFSQDDNSQDEGLPNLETNPSVFNYDQRSNSDDTSDSFLNYLRVTTRNILAATFSQTEETSFVGQGPTSSAIATNLLVIVVGDLVFEKIISKLSSPQFILQTVIGNIAGALVKTKKPVNTTPFHHKILSVLQKAYISITNITLAFGKQRETSPDSSTSLLYSPIFSLVDSITNITQRKPILAYLAKICRSVLLSSHSLSRKFDTISRAYLVGSIRMSPLLRDKFLAGIVQKLTDIVFSRTHDDIQPEDKNDDTIEGLATVWLSLLQGDLLPGSLRWVTYSGESEQDVKKSLEQFFAIFDADSKDHLGPYSPTSKLNKLLIIRLFDSIIQAVYPELVVEPEYSAGTVSRR